MTAARPLHVGMNLVHARPGAGGSMSYAQRLIAAMVAREPGTRVTAFVTALAPEAVRAACGPGVRFVRVPGAARPPVGSAGSLVGQWAVQPALARRLGLDVLHGPANAVAPLCPVPTVATILDLIWMHEPATMATPDRLAMQLVTRASARRADRLIAISAATRDDLVARLGVDPGGVDVVLLGASSPPQSPPGAGDVRARLELGGGRLVLCVAQKRSHKNLDALVRALALVEARDATLVLPGAATPYEDDLRRLAAARGVTERVRFLDWVADDDLERLYREASAFVLASRLEGFGLPIVDAMARGVPVACSDASALPEVAGGAALLFDPGDDAQIAAAIDRLLADEGLAADLRARGHARAAELTWDRAAERTLAAYRRAMA